jgi:hypothetical protein
MIPILNVRDFEADDVVGYMALAEKLARVDRHSTAARKAKVKNRIRRQSNLTRTIQAAQPGFRHRGQYWATFEVNQAMASELVTSKDPEEEAIEGDTSTIELEDGPADLAFKATPDESSTEDPDLIKYVQAYLAATRYCRKDIFADYEEVLTACLRYYGLIPPDPPSNPGPLMTFVPSKQSAECGVRVYPNIDAFTKRRIGVIAS